MSFQTHLSQIMNGSILGGLPGAAFPGAILGPSPGRAQLHALLRQHTGRASCGEHGFATKKSLEQAGRDPLSPVGPRADSGS